VRLVSMRVPSYCEVHRAAGRFQNTEFRGTSLISLSRSTLSRTCSSAAPPGCPTGTRRCSTVLSRSGVSPSNGPTVRPSKNRNDTSTSFTSCQTSPPLKPLVSFHPAWLTTKPKERRRWFEYAHLSCSGEQRGRVEPRERHSQLLYQHAPVYCHTVRIHVPVPVNASREMQVLEVATRNTADGAV
jgi:hypothetical protein